MAREESMGPVVGSGIVCAVLLVVGFGIISPISSVLGGVCELVAIASGLVFVGLIDGE
jgi:hypothetical protein